MNYFVLCLFLILTIINNSLYAGSHYNRTDLIEEISTINLFVKNIHQSSFKDGVQINRYTPIEYNTHCPVGCAPLAIGRIMNYYQYPNYDTFGYGNQYNLNNRRITNSFAQLVRDIGRYENAYYSIDGTGVSPESVPKAFPICDYNYESLLIVSDSRDEASNLYVEIKKEIDRRRPLLLVMQYTDSYTSIDYVGHALVVVGYKKVDPAYYGLEDLYIKVLSGQETYDGGFYDEAWIQIDSYLWWKYLFSNNQVTPDGQYKNVVYHLYGNIFPLYSNGGKVTILNPNGGEIIRKLNQTSIRWKHEGTHENIVKLYLYKNNRFHSFISRATFNDGSFSWTPDISLQSDSDYRIAIRNYRNRMIYDFSNRSFSIISP